MFDQNAMNSGFGGYGQPMGNMYYNPTMPQQPQKIMNTLTAEEIKELQQTSNVFNLGLTERESNQARCNHRSPDGTRDSLTYDSATGKARCTICGYEFTPIEPTTSYDDIKQSCDDINNILQTIKLLWPDMAVGAAREYYQIIALINKIPELFSFAAKNFNRHEFDLWNQQNTPGGMQMLQNLGNILGANQAMYFGGQPTYGGGFNPQFQQPMGAPMGNVAQPQPGFMNPPVAPQPMANPFGYAGASQVPNQGYAYTPQPNVAPVQPTLTAPAAPVAPATKEAENTTVTQQVTV